MRDHRFRRRRRNHSWPHPISAEGTAAPIPAPHVPQPAVGAQSVSGTPQTPGAVLSGSLGHPSQASPTPSPSLSVWSLLLTLGQLSQASPKLSPSALA